jgi:hypothetical protein
MISAMSSRKFRDPGFALKALAHEQGSDVGYDAVLDR